VAGDALLIAAFSGRAVAQSARRAGYVPLVADAFGDTDTREASLAVRVVDGTAATGFRTKPLLAALEDLAAASPVPPIGLVLGSGFEDKPRLVEALSARYRLIGMPAPAITSLKAPDVFFSALDALGVAHPLTTSVVPENGDGWLSKRIGGSGGRHIRIPTGAGRTHSRRYFQRRLDGERYSIGALLNADNARFWTTRQWIAPSGWQPFRYGGAVSSPVINSEVETALTDSARRVAAHFRLLGMVSFDFIVTDGAPQLLEVNARPGAALDVLDDDLGTQIAGHVEAFMPDKNSRSHEAIAPQQSRAAAILHADRGALVLGEVPWPDWSADRGAAGTAVPAGAPLATATAVAANAQQAESLARARLAQLADLIYGHAKPR